MVWTFTPWTIGLTSRARRGTSACACACATAKDEFTTDLAVPATNNAAERDLRPLKTQLKISGYHHAETGVKNWLAVLSDLVTATKHGLSAFDALLSVMTGNVWMPPMTLAT